MKIKQKKIEEIAFSSCSVPHKTIQFLSNYMRKESIKFENCKMCEFYNSCQRIKDIKLLYKSYYDKVIRDFLERLKQKQFNKDLFNDWAGPTYVVLMKDVEKIAEDMLKEIEQ